MVKRIEGWVAVCAACALCAAAVPSSAKEVGLHLSVQKDRIAAGSTVTLHWEIVPDGISTVAIILGVMLPDGRIECYAGPGKGFVELETIEAAPRAVVGFPFNTAMTASLDVHLPADWPQGTCQFVAAVMEGKAVAEVDYSNSFTVE